MNTKNIRLKAYLATTLSCLLIAVTLASHKSIPPRDRPNPYYIIQLSDPQLGFFNNDIDFVKDAEQLETAIAAVNRLKPAFVVVTGDLVNKIGDIEQITAYKRITAKLDRSIPLYNLPGNHDVGNEITAESLKTYRKHFGKDYYTIKKGGTTAIVLNSPLVVAGPDMAKAADAQYRWLEKTLKRASRSGDNVIIFQHHPWFLHDPKEADQYFNIPLNIRKKYLSLLRSYGVKHVFAGHLHYNAAGDAGDLEMITTGPVGRPLKDDPSGIRIIKVSGNSVTHEYCPLESIPEHL